jgi:cortical protein marker for cell polarity
VHPVLKTYHSGIKLVFNFFFLVLASAATAFAAVGDGHWDRQFAMPGTASRNFAMTFHDDKLYVAGVNFSNGQIATNTSVSVFDGTNWSSIGEITGGLPVIEDIAFLGNDLYVGGTFSAAGGVPAAGLAKWDGANWTALGFGGVVLGMTSDGTNLYVGGSFTNAGGVANTNLAKWDGTNWSTIGGGIGYYANSTTPAVNVIVWHNGQLYIGGNFTNAGPTPAMNLAVWNGSTWSQVGGAVGGVSDTVAAIQFFGDDLYIGGQFTTVGGVPALNIAHWDGVSWTALGTGLKGSPSSRPVNALAFLGSDLYATGNFTNGGGLTARGVAKWDGGSWSSLGSLNGSGIREISNSDSIYICGDFNLASNVIGDHVIRWDGANWIGITGKPAQGTHTIVQSLGIANDGIYMGGTFITAGTTPASHIARWDGANWNALAEGVSGIFNGNSVNVRAIKGSGSDVYIGGSFTTAGTLPVENVAHWDGANWQTMGYGVDNLVSAIDTDGVNVYVGGFFTNALNFPGGFITVNNIAGWNGSSWFALGSGVNGTVGAIAVGGGNVYIGGSFTSAGGVLANRIAMWNGSSWSSLNNGTTNGLSGSVSVILLDGSDVYVGGSFTNAGGVPARGIAKWNGSSWSALGQGMFSSSTASVRSLAKIGGYLYAGGVFTNAGGTVITRSVARWNGSSWEGLGSGVGNENSPGAAIASGLVAQGNDLYVGGIFETAGVVDSGYIAHWNDQIDFTPTPTMRLLNGQLVSGASFKFRVTATDRANYVVEQSSDLINWTPFTTNGVYQLDLSNSISAPGSRFFRMRETP